MILIDTSAWIDYFNGIENPTTALVDKILNEEPVLIGDLIYCELLQGFKTDDKYSEVKELLSNLMHVEMVGFEIAEKAAINYRRLRKKGITIRKTMDIIIATFCVENKVALIHKDRDFDIAAEPLGLTILK
ncbi:MAG TPA: PIN domain nuclease [bacterium]|nr:PIN domain nuclease [bacterium]